MKLFMYCLLLLFATMAVTAAPIRVRRDNVLSFLNARGDNVLSFLNDTLGTSTEETIPANTTERKREFQIPGHSRDKTRTETILAHRNPPNKPVREQDSEETANSFTDMSDEKSTESSDTSGFTGPEVSDKNGSESRDAVKGLDSDESMISKDVEKDKTPSKGKPNVGPMDISSKLVQDQQGSREHSGPQGPHQASRDLNSGEEMTVDENLSGKQAVHLSGDQVIVSLRRKPTPGGVHGVNGMLAPDRSRELLDRDSLEDNYGRPAPVGNRGDRDYDETREFISSETYPMAPSEHVPSSLSVLAKSRAS